MPPARVRRHHVARAIDIAAGVEPVAHETGQVGEGAVHHFITRALQGDELVIHGDGSLGVPEEAPSAWGAYFAVEDCPATVAAAMTLLTDQAKWRCQGSILR